MNIVFVAGIHAVGKSTACEAISVEFNIPHFTASQIIRAERSSAIPAASKLVTDVEENQRLLLQGISGLSANGGLLLDGHFTLQRQSDGGIEAISADVFREIQIAAIVVFIDEPAKIAKRMFDRDEVSLPIELIQTHQDAEVAHANDVASMLGVPIVVLSAFDIKGFSSAIKGWGISRHTF